MSAASPAAAPTDRPDPHQDRPAAGAPSRTWGLLGLLRKLVDYAKEFASTLHQRATAPDFYLVARRFGTADLALILARITRGLHLAGALEARLLRRADDEKNAAPVPPAPAPAVRDPSLRQPRATQPAASGANRAGDDLSARLPTAEEIAADLRCRPIGAVLADIARDIGIMPSHRLWRELCLAVGMHGGSFGRLWRDVTRPAFDDRSEFNFGHRAVGHAALPGPYPQFLAPAGTGPP
jgi:hypothetical protein